MPTQRRRPCSGLLAALMLLASTVTGLAQATPEATTRQLDSPVSFFVEPDSPASRQAEEWAETRPEDAALMTQLAAQPRADWFGDWTADPETEIGGRVTRIVEAGALPVLVFYTIPYRDCGLYSAGGANDPATYRA